VTDELERRWLLLVTDLVGERGRMLVVMELRLCRALWLWRLVGRVALWRLAEPGMLWRLAGPVALWRLEGREAELLRVVVVDIGFADVLAAAAVAGKVKGLGLWLGAWTGAGMRLGVVLEAGDERGEAKLAGSRGGRLGEPTLETRNEGRAGARGRVGVPPVNRGEGALIRRWLLADVWE
jgi:hypothetical protein